MKTFLSLLMLALSLNVCSGCFDRFVTKENKPDYAKRYKNNEVVSVDYPRVPGHVPDATKDAGTDSMCWGMVACNQLVYAGYVQDGQVCISNLLQDLGNEPNSVGAALAHYFDTYLAGTSFSNPDVYQATYGREDTETLEFIMNTIDEGRPVYLSMKPIAGQSAGHAVLVFGYELNDVGDELDLYLVDGDDNVHTTFLTVTWDGEFWPITGGVYTKFEIGYSLALTSATP